jgi:hypothetical protein
MSRPYTITLNGNVKTVTGFKKIGTASALFDGSGDYLTIVNPDSNLINWNTGAFTVEMWVYYNTFPNWGYNISNGGHQISNLIGNGSPTSDNTYWSFGPRSSQNLRFFYNDGNLPLIASVDGSTINRLQWYHLALVVDGSNIKIFKDGVLDASGTVSGTPQFSSSVPLSIAGLNNTSPNMYIDELRISNIARYSSNFTPSTTAFKSDANTLLLLHMDGANNGTVFEDDIGIVNFSANLSSSFSSNINASSIKPNSSNQSLEFLFNIQENIIKEIDSNQFVETNVDCTVNVIKDIELDLTASSVFNAIAIKLEKDLYYIEIGRASCRERV